jgi:hypothetical protein
MMDTMASLKSDFVYLNQKIDNVEKKIDNGFRTQQEKGALRYQGLDNASSLQIAQWGKL